MWLVRVALERPYTFVVLALLVLIMSAVAERLVREQMLAMLEWASDHPTKWHKIGNPRRRRKRPSCSPSVT
jgi:hypothetical protein